MTNNEYIVSTETLESSMDSESMLEPAFNTHIKNNEIEQNEVSDNRSDYKFIINMIKEMEEQYNLIKDIAISQAELNFNLTKNVYTGIIPITKENIEDMSASDIREFLTKYLIEDQQLPVDDDDELRKMMNQIKDTSLQLLSSKKDIDDIKSESNNMMRDYVNYLSSPIIQEKRAKRLQALKDAVEKTDDNNRKTEMMRMIATMEEAQNFAFLFSRFNTIGDKEIKSIVSSFFDKRKGAIVVDRYKQKIRKFGFDSMLYRYFFNLEENFLSEEYHVFNNLFLFIYMRFVSHADPYNKKDVLFVQSITSSLANLVYHKFNSVDNEDSFKGIIQKIVDNFMSYSDKFKNDNSTHPNHPIRIDIDNRKQKERRASLMAKMDELNITGYDENASADELQKYLNDELDKMITSQIESKKEDDDIIESAEENFESNTNDVVSDDVQ